MKQAWAACPLFCRRQCGGRRARRRLADDGALAGRRRHLQRNLQRPGQRQCRARRRTDGPPHRPEPDGIRSSRPLSVAPLPCDAGSAGHVDAQISGPRRRRPHLSSGDEEAAAAFAHGDPRPVRHRAVARWRLRPRRHFARRHRACPAPRRARCPGCANTRRPVSPKRPNNMCATFRRAAPIHRPTSTGCSHLSRGPISADSKDAQALAIGEEIANRDNAPQGHWTAGLAAYRLKRYDDAARHFDAILAGSDPGARRFSGAAFWSARSYMRAGHPERVMGLYVRAASEPGNFYGMIASRLLGREAGPPLTEPHHRYGRLRAPDAERRRAPRRGRVADWPSR